jgi:Leucine-rich repeat (LRR) protein
MSVIEIEGFKVYDGLDRQCVTVQSDRIDECLDFFYSGDFDGLWISRIHGYELENVDFLERYPDLTHVEIMSRVSDLCALHSLVNLKYLLISDNQKPLDFSCFTELESLYAEWSSKFENIAHCRNLKRISLRRYQSKHGNLSDLSGLAHLEEVGIVQSPIVSLRGLGELERLKKLELSHLGKLTLIDEIDRNAESLEFLMFSVCRKIRNHAFVRVLRKLRVLAFNDCGEMPSVAFVRQMPTLKDFRFVNTNVLDGDMAPCAGVDNASFFKKRHYSHSPEEIKALSTGSLSAEDASD